jgi:PAS domain S-box-containing protein
MPMDSQCQPAGVRERERLDALIRAELVHLGHCIPRAIWLAADGDRLELATDGGLSRSIGKGRVEGYLPAPGQGLGLEKLRGRRLLEDLAAYVGGSVQVWRKEPLSGAWRLFGAPHVLASPDAPVVEIGRTMLPQLSAEVCYLPFHEGTLALILEARPTTPWSGEDLEAWRRGIEALGSLLAVQAELSRYQAMQRLFEATLDTVHDGVLAGDEDGQFRIFNAGLEGLVGWSRAEAEEQGWPNLVYRDPGYRERMIGNIRRHFEGLQFDSQEVRLFTREGEEKACSLRTRRTEDELGRGVVIGAFRDITSIRQAERERLREVNLEALGQFAATIAHDFRNVLALVAGHASLLQRSLDPAVRTRAERITRAAERGDALSRRLLTFGGARPLRLESVDLAVELRRAIDLAVQRPQLQVVLDLPPLAPSIHADPVLLREVLDNLVTNALKAIGEGPGTLRLRVDADLPRLPPAFSAVGLNVELVHVSIQDSGPGFSQEARQHLFEPFFSTRADGHGLGLANVRNLLRQMEGAIDIPESGKGGRVDLWFAAAAVPPANLAIPRVHAPRGSEQIWVLDDEAEIVEVISTHLQSLGYRLRGFTEPAQLFEALRLAPDPPDAFIIDLQIGMHSGLQVLAQLRAELRRQPALICTGAAPGTLEDPRTSLLEKPFDRLGLAHAVRELLDRHALGTAHRRPPEAPSEP